MHVIRFSLAIANSEVKSIFYLTIKKRVSSLKMVINSVYTKGIDNYLWCVELLDRGL